MCFPTLELVFFAELVRSFMTNFVHKPLKNILDPSSSYQVRKFEVGTSVVQELTSPYLLA